MIDDNGYGVSGIKNYIVILDDNETDKLEKSIIKSYRILPLFIPPNEIKGSLKETLENKITGSNWKGTRISLSKDNKIIHSGKEVRRIENESNPRMLEVYLHQEALKQAERLMKQILSSHHEQSKIIDLARIVEETKGTNKMKAFLENFYTREEFVETSYTITSD